MTMIKTFAKAALKAAALGGGLAAARAALRRWRAIELEGCVVLVTGGSRGLGLALARRFAAEGARLALVARTAADLEVAAGELRGRGADVLAYAADVRAPEDAAAAVEAAIERFGRLDVLVNNAGVIQAGPLAHMQAADFEEAMDTHFWGAYHMTEAALEHLPRGGRIVNIASVGGLVAVPHLTPYAASKFALVGYSDGLRAELRGRGLYVTTACPGLMRTGSHVNAFFKGQHEKEYAWFSISDAQPLLSMSAEKAAEKIVAACRRGDPALTLTLPAKLAAGLSRLAPGLVGEAMAGAAWLLPAATGPEGDARRTGWESFSAWSPSPLTQPADAAVPKNNEGRKVGRDEGNGEGGGRVEI